jgi:bifunctional pyridoxal-dependent enzyme with beta-cystathionase and maltose regulon repressor activities
MFLLPIEENLLPLWIADMDFKAPAGVLQAYQKLLEHGILGIPFDAVRAKAIDRLFKICHFSSS